MPHVTVARMREADRRCIEELGIPGAVLMHNAGAAVFAEVTKRFPRPAAMTVACGKGNNGGDGLVIARQLFTRFHPRALDVVLLAEPGELRGDAAANYRMLEVCGCRVAREIAPAMRRAGIVLDALLGTGLAGPAKG
ncbi:MAG TPA: NAD(P)H-hydrate epimerase, partial [Candidatus Hydrogenedentes bacterium]|nr:NAD(P)H-hydrate epimerase [Candidatus Hydrogenedentota bacterium]